MNEDIYDDVHIERSIEAAFGLKLTITEVISRNVPTGFTSAATVFKTAPNALYVYIQAQSALLLADVRKMVRGMNLDAQEFVPPHGDADYFERIGVEKFKAMFPGKHIMSDDDIRYYQTLAPYSPALVKIERVKGEIRGFNFESKAWRKVRDYTFSRISLTE